MADEDDEIPGMEPMGEDDDALELDEDSKVVDTEDGGAEVEIDDETDEDENPEFYGNLAESLGDVVLQQIALGVVDDVERDKTDREKRDELYEEGLRRTGLGDDAPGGAQFQGASRVVHPMLTEACIDFAARAIKELMPLNGPDGGPVKMQIIGKPTQEKVEKAERKARHMNWQLTKQMREFRAELEQLLSQVPLAGAQYLKLVWDRRLKRPKPFFVPIDDVFLPFTAGSFLGSERKTHRQSLSPLDFARRVSDGTYRDVSLPTSQSPDESKAEQANQKIEGKEASSFHENETRIVYEVYCHLEIDEDPETQGGIAPYIVSVDPQTNTVLALYRNWDPEDEAREELAWMVEWPFIPWRGAYPIGITHIIGGLSGAATGALRALLDSAFLQNSPSAAKLKGGSIGGQNISIQPGQVAEIEGTPNSDDIRKVLMQVPYQGPSPVLFELLGFLVNAGKGVIQTTFEKLADQNPNQPVGTTMALIEQGSVVFSAIHARLHQAMGQTLEILHRLNRTYLEESDLFDDAGELLAKRDDYEGPVDVAPVSDPNIFSETQRWAQLQAIAQRAQLRPDLYDGRKVEELFLERTKIPDAKDLLVPRPEPQRLNAVNENVAATMGRPIVAYPTQDHLAHLQVHIDYLLNPMLGQNPLIAPIFVPAMLNHIKDHLALWYVDTFVKLTSEAAGIDISKLMDDDDEVSAEMDRTLATASPVVGQIVVQELQKLPPIIQQAMQIAQQFQPPQPGDPTQVAMLAAQAQMQEVQRKTQADQMKTQMDQMKVQMEAQLENQRMQMENQRLQIEQQFRQMQLDQQQKNADAERAAKLMLSETQQRNADAERAAKLVMAEKSEATKQAIAEQSTAADLKTNSDDNATALTIANMEIESNREARHDEMLFDEQQAEAMRRFNEEQAQVDRMYRAVDKQTDREHAAAQAAQSEKAKGKRNRPRFRGERVGLSNGTGINPNPNK